MAGPGERYLLPTERRVVSVRLHPVVLSRTLLEVVGALVVAGAVDGRVADRLVLDDIVWWAALAVLARGIWRVLEWSHDRFVVTDRRILLVSGLFTRRVAMMPLRKVTDMTYERSALGRLLGYGEFVMESAGQDQALRRVRFLPSPDRLYLDVSALLFGGDASGTDDVPEEDLVEIDDPVAERRVRRQADHPTEQVRPWWVGAAGEDAPDVRRDARPPS